MKTGQLTIKGTVQKSWQKIYETILSAATTSLTISGLDGNTDILYKVVIKLVSNATGMHSGVLLNNDTGSNYGFQYLLGVNTAVSSERGADARIYVGSLASGIDSGKIGKGECLIYTKSGYVRTAIVTTAENISTTTITSLSITGQSWNNTADNITSIVLASTMSNGYGIGTYVALYRRRA